MNKTHEPLPEYDVNDGGPFVELLIQLRLWRKDQDTRVARALVLVGLAWLVPLLIAATEGNAFGPAEEEPFLLSLNAWARYFVAVGLFVLSERTVADQLRDIMSRFFDAPIIAEADREKTAALLVTALKRRNSATAEIVIALLALLTPAVTVLLASVAAPNSWIMTTAADGTRSLTWAGAWGIFVSGAIFFFLLYRWVWRMAVWSRLLSGIGGLNLRLAVQHPDGAGGLGFVGLTPIAFTPLAFAVGLWIAPVVAQLLRAGDMSVTTFTIVLAVWLALVHGVLALPLWSFRAPLEALKGRTQRSTAADATNALHSAEQAYLQGNQPDAAEPPPAVTAPGLYAAAGNMHTVLFSRASIVPVSVAALLPLCVAGATQFPIREVFSVLKKLVLF